MSTCKINRNYTHMWPSFYGPPLGFLMIQFGERNGEMLCVVFGAIVIFVSMWMVRMVLGYCRSSDDCIVSGGELLKFQYQALQSMGINVKKPVEIVEVYE